MNKITELKQAAGLYTDTSGRWANADAVDKLVELIVRECARVARNHTLEKYSDMKNSYTGVVFVEESIKKHFGVKE
jgi:hypothetical protein